MSQENRSWISRLLGRFDSKIPARVDPCDDPSRDSDVDCQEVRASASDYIDGETSTSLTHRIKDHLGLCSDCNGWVRSLAATVGFMKELPEEPVPDTLMAKIKDIPDRN